MSAPATPLVLAIDAGGSHTRALLADGDARPIGRGLSTSGNATAVGTQTALAAIGAASRAALNSAGRSAAEVTRVVFAAAGERGRIDDARLQQATAGGPVALTRIPDLLGMYHSAAIEPDGVALVAGTGAVAGRFRDTRPVRVVDGLGWLLGDAGSGFWIGREVARAAVAQLDGLGPTTALTAGVLAHFGITGPDRPFEGRSALLDPLLEHVYGDVPVRLARLAPLAFAAESDPVAADIVYRAEAALARLLATARDGADGLPVVIGGSVLTHGILAHGRTPSSALGGELTGDVRRAADGVAGAAVVGLIAEHVTVTAAQLASLAADGAAP